MSVWAIVLVIGLIVVVGAVVGVLGLVVLHGLATVPDRFPVRREIPLEEIDAYIERTAAFAIAVTVNTPLSRTEVWERLAGAAYLSTLPLLSGPTWTERDGVGMRGVPVARGESRSLSGGVLAVSQRVVDVTDRRSMTLAGTGVSVPLVIDSFVERWTLVEGNRGTVDVTWEIAGGPRWVGWLPWRWGAPFVRPILAFVLRHILRLKPFRSVRNTSPKPDPS